MGKIPHWGENLLADYCAIFIKSKQGTFYTVAFKNFVSLKQLLLGAGLTVSVVSAQMNLMMGAQLLHIS